MAVLVDLSQVKESGTHLDLVQDTVRESDVGQLIKNVVGGFIMEYN